MAKKENRQDETPIAFHVPGPGGRGSKVPIPINQPNWKYRYYSTSKPGALEWLSIGFTIIIITVSILALYTRVDRIPILWIIIIPLGLFPIFLIASAILRIFYHSEKSKEDEPSKSTQKREKKQPKRPKNYK